MTDHDDKPKQHDRRRMRASGWRRAASCAGLLALALLCVGVARAADTAAPAASAKEPPVRLEAIPGSPNKRVVLSAKAAERLDVKLGTIEERVIVPAQMVGGIVVDPSAAGAAAAGSGAGGRSAATRSDTWVRINVSPAEWAKMARDKPVRIFPLQTRPELPQALIALPVERVAQENSKSGMTTVFYSVQASAGVVLVPGNRVRVEVQLEGGAGSRKTVPYSAVHYDAKGEAWVYVSTAPLAFVRERIVLDRVVGEYALLTSGPPAGTQVATVGVSLLYGAEVFGK